MQFCIHKEDASRRSGLHHIGKIRHFFSNKMKKIRKFFMRIKIVKNPKAVTENFGFSTGGGMPCGNGLK